MTSQDEATKTGGTPRKRVTAERLSGVEDWEVYRFFDRAKQEAVCTIALRPAARAGGAGAAGAGAAVGGAGAAGGGGSGAGGAAVEYAVWREREDGDDPGSTGTIDWQAEGALWNDAAREDVLRQVAYRYEEELAVPQEALAFRIGGEGEGEEDEDGEEEEEEDEGDADGEEDGDADEDEDGE